MFWDFSCFFSPASDLKDRSFGGNSGRKKTMTARDVTEFCAFCSAQKSGNFLRNETLSLRLVAPAIAYVAFHAGGLIFHIYPSPHSLGWPRAIESMHWPQGVSSLREKRGSLALPETLSFAFGRGQIQVLAGQVLRFSGLQFNTLQIVSFP